MTEIKFDKTRYHLHPDMSDWCTMQFGPACRDHKQNYLKTNLSWGYSIMFGNTCWTFRDNKHAVLFALRWGS